MRKMSESNHKFSFVFDSWHLWWDNTVPNSNQGETGEKEGKGRGERGYPNNAIGHRPF